MPGGSSVVAHAVSPAVVIARTSPATDQSDSAPEANRWTSPKAATQIAPPAATATSEPLSSSSRSGNSFLRPSACSQMGPPKSSVTHTEPSPLSARCSGSVSRGSR